MSTLARSKWCQSSINFWRRVKLVKVLPASQTPGMIVLFKKHFSSCYAFSVCSGGGVAGNGGVSMSMVSCPNIAVRCDIVEYLQLISQISHMLYKLLQSNQTCSRKGIWPDLCGELNLARKIKEYQFKPRMTLGIEDYSERLRTIFTRIRAYKLLLLGRDWHRT